MNTSAGSATATSRRSLALIGANAGLALHPVDAGGTLLPGEPAEELRVLPGHLGGPVAVAVEELAENTHGGTSYVVR